MPGLSDYAENKLLDAILGVASLSAQTAPWVKLHTGDPGENGTTNAATETTRKQVTFGAASAGVSANSGLLRWDNVAATETVRAFSLWDAATAGNCIGTGWLGASVRVMATFDTTGNLWTAVAHGLAASDIVTILALDGSTVPTSLAAGTIYSVSASPGADTFGLSVNGTTKGRAMVYKLSPVGLTAGDSAEFAIGALTASLD